MRNPAAGSLFAGDALLPDGWARNVLLRWDAKGMLTAVTPDTMPTSEVPRAAGPVLPGMVNLHSHAFQRGFAGLTEFRSAEDDSFWSWRALMYRFAQRLSPDTLEAIATYLYIEMLRAGYTSVCEFHYVHHQPDGKSYADPGEMSLRLLRAAEKTGIGITLLPVLYQTSGFGQKGVLDEQRRFVYRTDAVLALLQRLGKQCHGNARLGLAPHSLRAVPLDSLREALDGLAALDAQAPVHIHIAEQQQEVNQCLAWTGTRPVAWLLDHVDVDARWCLVHATHMDWDERRRLAASGAVAGICPTTEANLGDGVFEASPYLEQGGWWGIGSDSHASVSVTEELRLFEYGQRLGLQRRNVLASDAHGQVADRLYLGASAGGARASGRPVAGLRAGQQADFVVLDGRHPSLAGLQAPQALATHVFANQGHETLAEVRCAGLPLVRAGRHALQDSAGAAFVQARAALLRE
ncbi:formimidoylglutamate deiminase [Cupriavidus sp. AU9028]|uniref:formimidoylglutamate deiminase n=1 Tax=Cupriavidus sp. AU9028 TaxID=2871157 RepID=UPI001C96CF23|nr:formimidoylglutamate deiminase [Cupriavidus sp. AU9028]MBY4897247.1 formimidoylglutamate deiminase [Cupriavidus sp. AU9028]